MENINNQIQSKSINEQTDIEVISVENMIELANYDQKTRQAILEIYNQLDFSSDKAIMSIGSTIASDISTISKRVLQNIKVKNLPELTELIPQLDDAFSAVDTSMVVKRKGFGSILDKMFSQKQTETFISKFESAEKVVNSIQSSLEIIELELRKDIEVEDALGNKNIEYIRDLQYHIAAMKIKLNDTKNELEEKSRYIESQVNPDFLDVQQLEELRDRVESVEQQIYWLEQQRLLAIQTLPVLRNLKKNNKNLIRQINLAIHNSIPTWEQGIAIAFHMQRQHGALEIERAVHDMTNQVVLNNSKLLKENSVEISKAVRSGMIDIEVFQEANRNLIEATEQVQKLALSSMQDRIESISEYKTLTQNLIEAENKSVSKLRFLHSNNN